MESTRSAQRRQSGANVTLSQVAEKAGVHPGTVSRALHGDARVAPATIEHIQRIAKELKYVPHVAARVLAMGKTRTIAIATGPSNEHYYAQILHYLEKELAASRYKRLILSSRDIQGDLFASVNAGSVDGVLAIDSFPHMELLAEHSSLPCVCAGVVNSHWTNIAAVDNIEIDLSRAVREAVRAMLEGGCRRVAYVVTNAFMASTNMGARNEVRVRVYAETLAEADLRREVIDLDIEYADMGHGLMRERLLQYIGQHGCPDGLLCQNDEVAIVVQSVVKECGLRIPEDVQVVGCDGLPYMEFLSPPISTIVQPAQQMCALAWQFLQNRLENPSLPRQHAVLEAELCVRPSLKASSL